MIVVVDSLNKHQHSDILDEMFRLRARSIRGCSGMEHSTQDMPGKDVFDSLDPAYVIGLDGAWRVVSCARLLQTTGPHMLDDICCLHWQEEPPLRSALLWEASCFCVDSQRLCPAGQGDGPAFRGLCAMMVAILEYARRSGVQDIIAVIEQDLDRVFRQTGIAPRDALDAPGRSGAAQAVATFWACSDQQISQLRAVAEIDGDVFADEVHVRRVSARNGQPVHLKFDLTDDVALYLLEQIDAAKTPQELQDAIALTRHMLEPGMPGECSGVLRG